MLISYKEAQFLSGNFFRFDVPFEKNYLFKYFRSPLETQFLRYYLCFQEIDHFVDHTGLFCQKRWLLILKKRLLDILKLHSQLKSEFRIEELRDLEKGKYRLLK